MNTLIWLLLVSPLYTFAALVDLTSVNRRGAVEGLPDWSKAGYEQGAKDLPGPSSIGKTITADMLKTNYTVVADDGKDDTAGLQKAITGAAVTLVVVWYCESTC